MSKRRPNGVRRPGLGHYECTKCGTTKAETLFYLAKRRTRPHEVSSQCKDCHNAGVRAAYDTHPKRFGNRRKCSRCHELRPLHDYNENQRYCRTCQQQHQAKTWRELYSQRSSEEKLAIRLRKYQLSPEQFRHMTREQRGCCAICRLPCADLHVDHCHETGVVRGLLCSPCNKGIGLFRDDPIRLLGAILYLNQPVTVAA